MKDTKAWAQRTIEGGELYLRCPPGGRWEVTFYERVSNRANALTEGVLRFERLAAHYFNGRTFKSPDDAAAYVRGLLAH